MTFSSPYLHDTACRVLDEKVEDAAVVIVSRSRLAARDHSRTEFVTLLPGPLVEMYLLYRKDDLQTMAKTAFWSKKPVWKSTKDPTDGTRRTRV